MIKKFKWPIIIFIVALAARLLVFILLLSSGDERAIVTGDGAKYIRLAESLANGLGYSDDEGFGRRPEAYRPPGYPLYLSFFLYRGLPLEVASLVQIIISALIPVTLFLFAANLKDISLWTVRLAGFFAAIEPLQVWYSVVLVADVFFSLLLLGALLLLLNWLNSQKVVSVLIAGALLGLAGYFRPVGLYLSIFLAMSFILYFLLKKTFSRQRFLHLIFFILATWVVVIPWQINNFYVWGTFSFSSLGVSNFYDFAAPAILSIEQNRPFDDVNTELRDRFKKEAPDPLYVESFKNEDYILTQVFNLIKKYPWSYVKGYFLGVNTLLFSGNYHFMLQRYNVIEAPKDNLSYSLILAQEGFLALVKKILETVNTPYGFVALSGKIGWVILTSGAIMEALRRRKESLGFFFLVILAYFILANIPMALSIEGRHRYALNPLIFLLFLSLYHRIFSGRVSLSKRLD
ncbi:MAG: hypothetical protein AAB725_01310 [Patescibacteria group bacterium]